MIKIYKIMWSFINHFNINKFIPFKATTNGESVISCLLWGWWSCLGVGEEDLELDTTLCERSSTRPSLTGPSKVATSLAKRRELCASVIENTHQKQRRDYSYTECRFLFIFHIDLKLFIYWNTWPFIGWQFQRVVTYALLCALFCNLIYYSSIWHFPLG